MQMISVSELRQNLSLYLEKVKEGGEIIVEDENEVIARITPFDEDAEEKILVEQGLRGYHVTLGFRHFLTVGIKDPSRERDIAPWHATVLKMAAY